MFVKLFKKYTKNIKSVLTAAFLTASLISCNAGLGEEVDVENPVLKITSNNNMDYVPKSFVISGTCSDNHSVKKIEVKNTSTKKILGYATISGDKWEFKYTCEEDIELPLTFTAIDGAGNSGESSIGQITVVIDSVPPVLNDVYIKRAGKYQLRFATEAALNDFAESETDTGSKDFLQNESIEIIADVSDNYRADDATITILDKDGNVIAADIAKKADSNAYRPEFVITQDNMRSLTGDEKYYLAAAEITLRDQAGNPCKALKKYFCWYPESDLPKVDFTIATENVINVGKEADIPVNIFDDDGIEKVYSKIVSADYWKGIFDGDKITSLEGFNDVSGDGARDLSITEKASGVCGDYVYAVAVKDKKADGSEGVWKYAWCDVTVTADANPIIVIDAPAENSAPALSSNKFTLNGYAIDEKPVLKAAYAWVPAGLGEEVGIPAAKNLLKGFDFADSDVHTDDSGIKYQKLDLGTPAGETIGSKTYKKSSFSKDFDVTEDFKYDNKDENAVKTFVFYVVSSENIGIYKTFRLGSYSDSPEVSIKYNGSELDDMTTNVTVGTEFGLEISAKGYRGLKLKSLTGSWKAENDSAATPIDDLDKSGVNDFTLKIEKDQRYTLSVTAEDIFGNKITSLKTFVPGEVATLTKFSSGMKNGIILVKDDVLTMQAEFTGIVSNMNGTKIKLTGIKFDPEEAGDSEEQYAVCTSAASSDTIQYTYTVPDGAYTESGVAVSSGTKILKADKSDLYGLTDETQVLGKNATIYVDAVAPKIVSYSPAQNKVIGDNKKITITFDDEIELESGTITVERSSGWAIPPVLTADEFTTIYASLSNADKINFIGSATGSPVLTENSAQPVGPYKKVTHGVKEFTDAPAVDKDGDPIYVDNTGDAVPDSSTKYVLAFDYDIFETDGAVEKIRKALEGYGYHKKDYDISDSAISVDENKLIITLDDDVLVDGREFTVTIPAGCVRDAAGNVNKKLDRDTYKFWSQKTAKPVIRTDRYTHGADAPEPYLEDGEIKIRTIGKEDITSAPTGQIRVRIDCETPNASIRYGIKTNKSEKGVSELAATQSSKVANMTMSAFKALSCDQTYSKIFLAGTSGWEKAEKNYIRAVAKKSAQGSEPALSESDSGLEMATKTVLYYSKPNSDREYLYFQGSDSIGEPVASAFPMRDANPDMRWSRYAYKTNTNPDAAAEDAAKARNNDWVGVSWDIITSDWRLQSITHNWQNPETKGLDYGILRFNVGQGYYD